MKSFLAIALAMMLTTGCALFSMNQQPCNIYEKFGATPENSLIAAKIEDPCAASRIISMVSKLPVIKFEKLYIDAFNEWADRVRSLIATGITYKSVQDMIILKIAQLNVKAGLTMFILSDGILVFDTQQLIMPKDVELLTSLIDDLKRQVNALGAML